MTIYKLKKEIKWILEILEMNQGINMDLTFKEFIQRQRTTLASLDHYKREIEKLGYQECIVCWDFKKPKNFNKRFLSVCKKCEKIRPKL